MPGGRPAYPGPRAELQDGMLGMLRPELHVWNVEAWGLRVV